MNYFHVLNASPLPLNLKVTVSRSDLMSFNLERGGGDHSEVKIAVKKK